MNCWKALELRYTDDTLSFHGPPPVFLPLAVSYQELLIRTD